MMFEKILGGDVEQINTVSGAFGPWDHFLYQHTLTLGPLDHFSHRSVFVLLPSKLVSLPQNGQEI